MALRTQLWKWNDNYQFFRNLFGGFIFVIFRYGHRHFVKQTFWNLFIFITERVYDLFAIGKKKQKFEKNNITIINFDGNESIVTQLSLIFA